MIALLLHTSFYGFFNEKPDKFDKKRIGKMLFCYYKTFSIYRMLTEHVCYNSKCRSSVNCLSDNCIFKIVSRQILLVSLNENPILILKCIHISIHSALMLYMIDSNYHNDSVRIYISTFPKKTICKVRRVSFHMKSILGRYQNCKC